jgi:hypothetical protein
VPRRLLALVVTALALAAVTGCADDVSPAVRIGDTTISDDELFDEVAEWAGNEPLRTEFRLPAAEGQGIGTYSMDFTGQVLITRMQFEVHSRQFEELGLELSDDERADMRERLLGDPELTARVLRSFSEDYGNRLVEDAARQFAVQQAMGAEYEAWAAEALDPKDVEVSPRFGTWTFTEAEGYRLVPPDGPIGSATTAPPFGA